MIDENKLKSSLGNVANIARDAAMAAFEEQIKAEINTGGKFLTDNWMLSRYRTWMKDSASYEAESGSSNYLSIKELDNDAKFEYQPVMTEVNWAIDTSDKIQTKQDFLRCFPHKIIRAADKIKKTVASALGMQAYSGFETEETHLIKDLIKKLQNEGWEFYKEEFNDEFDGEWKTVVHEDILVNPNVKGACLKFNETEDHIISVNGTIPLNGKSSAGYKLQYDKVVKALRAKEKELLNGITGEKEELETQKEEILGKLQGNKDQEAINSYNEALEAIQDKLDDLDKDAAKIKKAVNAYIDNIPNSPTVIKNVHYERLFSVMSEFADDAKAKVFEDKRLCVTLSEAKEEEFIADISNEVFEELQNIAVENKFNLFSKPETAVRLFLEKHRLNVAGRSLTAIDKDSPDFRTLMKIIDCSKTMELYNLRSEHKDEALKDLVLFGPTAQSEALSAFAPILAANPDATYGDSEENGIYVIDNVKKVIDGKETYVRYVIVSEPDGTADILVFNSGTNSNLQYSDQQRLGYYSKEIIQNMSKNYDEYLHSGKGDLIGAVFQVKIANLKDAVIGIDENKVNLDRSISLNVEGEYVGKVEPLFDAIRHTQTDVCRDIFRQIDNAPPGLVLPYKLMDGNVTVLIRKNDYQELANPTLEQREGLESSNGFTMQMVCNGDVEPKNLIFDAAVTIGEEETIELLKSIDSGTRTIDLQKAYNLTDCIREGNIVAEPVLDPNIPVQTTSYDTLFNSVIPTVQERRCAHLQGLKDTIDDINAIAPGMISVSCQYSTEFDAKNMPNVNPNRPNPEVFKLNDGSMAYIPDEKRNTESAVRLLATGERDIVGVMLNINGKEIEVTQNNYNQVLNNDMVLEVCRAFESSGGNGSLTVMSASAAARQITESLDSGKITLQDFAHVMSGAKSLDQIMQARSNQIQQNQDKQSPAKESADKPKEVNKPKAKYDRTDD